MRERERRMGRTAREFAPSLKIAIEFPISDSFRYVYRNGMVEINLHSDQKYIDPKIFAIERKYRNHLFLRTLEVFLGMDCC